MPKVSIILPLYNADIRCLDDCIRSIQAQTYEDFECIFVNDGSPSRECVEYACRLTKGDSRFRLVEKSNGGLASARNFGFKSSKGDYITFVDQDDLLHPQRVELAVKAMESVSADVCECKALRPSFNASFKVKAYPVYEISDVLEHANVLKGIDILKWYLAQKMNITVWSHVYKRHVIESNELPECVWGSDDLAYNIVNASRIRTLIKIIQPLYFWRRNPKATTGRVPYAYIEGVVQAIEYVVAYYKNNPISDYLNDSLVRYLAGAFIDVMRDILQVGRNETERKGLIALTVKANALLHGGIASNASIEDKQWVGHLLDNEFAAAVHGSKTVIATIGRRRRINRLKRFIKNLIGRK